MLNNQAPARFLRAPAVALKANCELFEFVAGKHFGLSSHGHGIRTPLWGTLRQFGESCHRCLDSDLLKTKKAIFDCG
jgi:hypothetical protein